MKKLLVLGVLCVLVFGGCYMTLAKPPTLAETNSADCGVAPENPKEQALARLKIMLPDPMSAVVEWQGECVKSWWFWPPPNYTAYVYNIPEAQKVVFGWSIDANVNAKNLLGGYVGFRLYTFCFRDGNLLNVKRPDY
jgi:hypothetical protein